MTRGFKRPTSPYNSFPQLGLCQKPIVLLGPPIVDEASVLAENRMAPVVEPMIQFGPNNRYIEVAISLCHVAALGRGTNLISYNNRTGVVSDLRYLQSKGIVTEFSAFKHSDLQDLKDWIVEPGTFKPPIIVDTLMGVHNSPCPRSTLEALEWLFTYVRMLPQNKGVLLQMISGGRFWLPITIASIILGYDIVRVGLEDAIHMYPHRNDLITSAGKVVETVAGIARYFGREVATPAEARKMLGLPQIT